MSEHSPRRQHSRSPRTLRSVVMRHVVGFSFLFGYLLMLYLSELRTDPTEGTVSNLSVVIPLLGCAIAYGLGYALYKPVHRAWVDSKN